MLSIIKTFTIIIAIFVTNNLYAQQMNIEIAGNTSKIITNNYVWTLSATCKIQTKEKNTIRVSMYENKGSLNGQDIAIGKTRSVTVHNNDSIAVSAEPGCKVTLQNLSSDPIQATCST